MGHFFSRSTGHGSCSHGSVFQRVSGSWVTAYDPLPALALTSILPIYINLASIHTIMCIIYSRGKVPLELVCSRGVVKRMEVLRPAAPVTSSACRRAMYVVAVLRPPMFNWRDSWTNIASQRTLTLCNLTISCCHANERSQLKDKKLSWCWQQARRV